EQRLGESVANGTKLVVQEIKDNTNLGMPYACSPIRRLKERLAGRGFLDAFLDGLVPENLRSVTLQTAAEARVVSKKIFSLRCKRLVCFWVGILAFGIVATLLGSAIWKDTFTRPNGELFSLSN